MRPTSRLQERVGSLSQALKQDYVGLEETADGIRSIYVYDVLLGKLGERRRRIYS